MEGQDSYQGVLLERHRLSGGNWKMRLQGAEAFIGLVIKVMRTRRVTRISDPLIFQVGNFFGRCGENWRAMFQTIGNTRGSATNGCFPSSVGKMMPNFGMLLMLMEMRSSLVD